MLQRILVTFRAINWFSLSIYPQLWCRDDEWFFINHLFHQCSSRQLISAFAHSAGIHVNIEFDILEQSSPELPPSVSNSRGKRYTSRDGLQGKQMLTFGDQHTVKNLNKNSSFVNSESTRVAGNRTKKGKNNKLAGSILDSRSENNLTENAGQHNIGTVALGDQKFTYSNFSGKGESSSSSTITSEGSGQQQPNSFEISSHVFGHARGFLSALKISLRKSCVTREASRVEVTNGRLSKGQKSSSSKSSMGSSLSIACDEKILTSRNDKDITLSDRDVRMPMTFHNKVDGTKLSNAPSVRPAKLKLSNQSFKAPSINQGNAKVKLVPHCVNRRYTTAAGAKAKEKVVARSSNLIPGGGKENVTGKAASFQKSSTTSTAQVEKITTRVPEKSTRTTVVPKGRISERSKGSKTGKMREKAYFR